PPSLRSAASSRVPCLLEGPSACGPTFGADRVGGSPGVGCVPAPDAQARSPATPGGTGAGRGGQEVVGGGFGEGDGVEGHGPIVRPRRPPAIRADHGSTTDPPRIPAKRGETRRPFAARIRQTRRVTIRGGL